MPANLENSAVAAGLENVSFHFNPKERQCQRMFKLYKKDLNDSDNHDGVITHLEPDILECEVKCTLGSITTNKDSEGDGIQLSYFKS